MKVIGIDGGKKPEPPCEHCGSVPAHAGFTCPRIAKVWCAEDTGEWEITYRATWQPKTPDPAA